MPGGLLMRRTTPRMRAAIAGVACVSAVLGVVIAGGTAMPRPRAEPITDPVITPDGGPATFQILTRQRTAEDRINNALPPEVLAGINVSEARFARRFRGVRVFVAPMLTGTDICVIMIAQPWAPTRAAINCAPPEWLATGRQAMKLQGARGEEAIYAGIVPDGVTGVTVGAEDSSVEGNVITLRRESGRLDRGARYRLRNGDQRQVEIPVDDAVDQQEKAPRAPSPPKP
jgi:hypothetical protein